jgi:hypothetical protein
VTALTAPLLVLSLAAPAPEKAPSSPEQLRSLATHVCVGTVESMQVRAERDGAWEYERYELVLRVEAVEKDTGGTGSTAFAPGDTLRVRCWTKSWGLPTPTPPDTSGHAPLPVPGERGRAHLVNTGYNGFGETRDGGFDLLGRNGWEPLGSALSGDARRAAEQRIERSGLRIGVLPVLLAAGGLAAIGLALLLVLRRRSRSSAA